MSLINCPECSHEISDRAPACPHCGFPLGGISETVDAAKTDKTIEISVTMSKQTFLMSATVTVSLNNVEVAWVGDGQTATFKAPAGENAITLRANMRKRAVNFTAHKNVIISAKWNRLTGSLDALCTGDDVVLR